VSIPQLANLLIERSQNASWVVVFKSLITVHHLMCYGNEASINNFVSFNHCILLNILHIFRDLHSIWRPAIVPFNLAIFWIKAVYKVNNFILCWCGLI